MIYSILKGRIGNNLFQIAAGYTLAKRNKTGFIAFIPDFILPEPDKCTLKEYLGQFRKNILRDVQFTDTLPSDYEKHYEAADLSFCEIPFKGNFIIDGYFQSEKYFDQELIRSLFSIDGKTKEYIEIKYGKMLAQEVTSINIRRGDFVKQPHLHPVCSMKYYNDAINHFKNGQRFLIISDDIKWCRRHFKGDNFYFVEDESPVIDLYLQTSCSNNIISNSSFSWWGAWLNNNPGKIVIAPDDNWIGKHQNVSVKDLLPAEWIKIANPMELRMKPLVLYYDAVKMLFSFKKAVFKF